MHTIILEDFGTFLGKKGDRFIVKQKGKTLGEFPASQVDRVIISSTGASLSSAAIYLAVDNRIPLAFTYSDGSPFGFLTPTQGHGTVRTRRAQYVHADSEYATHLSRRFIEGKTLNQKSLLNLWAKNRTRTNPEISDCLNNLSSEIEKLMNELETIEGPMSSEIRNTIMNLEGRIALNYWTGLSHIIPSSYGFTTRNTRGADDPFNMLLNYGYGILYSEVWSAVNIAGLDPFAGFLHADRPGRPSLVLDLIEEFRQQAVDRILVRLTTKKMIDSANVIKSQELSKEVRSILATEIVNRLSQQVDYQNKKISLKNIIVRQAWMVAKFLRDEVSEYRPFHLRW